MKTKSRTIRWFALLLALLMAGLCGSAAADELVFPADITAIKAEAFRNCTSLTGSLVIPEGVTEIGEYAFAGCTGLTGVPVIPRSVQTIGAHAFDGCTGLSGTLYFSWLIDIDETAFENCPNLRIVYVVASDLRVAVIGSESTPWGDTLDGDIMRSVSAFCTSNGMEYKYFNSADAALEDGYSVIISIGADFEELAEQYPEAYFIGLDTSTEAEEQQPNTFYICYQEEQAGYLAGYAAVKLGYRKLGFLGGMVIPPVVRYGKGFVKGADDAANELNIANQVTVDYAYSGVFWPDANVRTAFLKMIDRGVEAVFCCGGSQWVSVVEEAEDNPEVMIIGVDTDQANILEGRVVTSAMKAVGVSAQYALEHIATGAWEEIGGASVRLGVEGENPSQNFVQLPESTMFSDSFTAADYAALVAKLYQGELTADIDAAVTITVNEEE